MRYDSSFGQLGLVAYLVAIVKWLTCDSKRIVSSSTISRSSESMLRFKVSFHNEY